jgi:hypothetical protein
VPWASLPAQLGVDMTSISEDPGGSNEQPGQLARLPTWLQGLL